MESDYSKEAEVAKGAYQVMVLLAVWIGFRFGFWFDSIKRHTKRKSLIDEKGKR